MPIANLQEKVKGTAAFLDKQCEFFNKLKNGVEVFVEFLPKLANGFNEFCEALQESNIQLLAEVGEGQKNASEKLARLWWRRLWPLFSARQKSQGFAPTIEDFCHEISVACHEVFSDEKTKYNSPFEAAKRVFYKLQSNFKRDIVLDIGARSPAIKSYRDHEDKTIDGYFTSSIAQHLGLKQPTVTNWAKSGDIKARKITYRSALTGGNRPAYIIDGQTPLSKLETLKTKKEQKMRHQRPGLWTVGQLVGARLAARKTLERWDKKGILSPIRIDGYRYYTAEQAKLIKELLNHSKSRRLT